MKRLKFFSVSKLFGLFDHEVPFFLEDRVTLVHSPNGYGKTVILKLISGFFGGSLAIFASVEFEEIVFILDDDTRISIKQGSGQRELLPLHNISSRKIYTISMDRQGNEYTYSSNDRRIDQPTSMMAATVDKYLPYLRRVANRSWFDTNTSETIGLEEVVERYWEYLPVTPAGSRRGVPHPDWLEEIRKSVPCRLIETQRLLIIEKEASYSKTSMKPVVRENASELARIIGLEFGRTARVAQTLDSSFPNRLLSKIRSKQPPPSEEALKVRLKHLEEKRDRLSNVGLFDPNIHSELITQSNLNENERRILSEYVDDTTKKLDAYNVFLSKLEAFKRIINDHFQFKRIDISQENGFKIVDIRGRTLPIDSLSSGEQHELVLLYDLLFKTSPGTLVMIDEPEISLHVAWQRQFLDDLKDVIDLTQLDVLLATHSPQLIGANLDLTIQLQAPTNVVSY